MEVLAAILEDCRCRRRHLDYQLNTVSQCFITRAVYNGVWWVDLVVQHSICDRISCQIAIEKQQKLICKKRYRFRKTTVYEKSELYSPC
jgi:hypothetical protein